MSRVDLSIVIPVYNSGDIFPELYRELTTILANRIDTYEIIAVIDGCKDNSFEVISSFCASDSRVKLIDFARNFGHQSAVTAGLEAARGDLVAVMDDDLEDPPDILLELVRKLDDGYDVVYGVRRVRHGSWVRRVMNRQFYRVLNWFSDIDMPHDAGDFCVMRRPVVEALKSLPESNRYIRGLRAWVGFRQVGIEYDRGNRFASASGYTLRTYFRLALDAMFAFSYKPLVYVSVLGVAIAMGSFLAAAVLVAMKLFGQVRDVPGWVSLFVVILFLGGVQLISVGVLGQYLMRVYDEVKRRPVYVVRRRVNFDSSGSRVDAGTGEGING